MKLPDQGSELARVEISKSQDVVIARFNAKKQAEAIGFATRDIIKISTAVSELARNIVQHAKGPGSITIYQLQKAGHHGIGILANDRGIGMTDPNSIMQQASSIMSGGLFGTKRLANEFEIESYPGRGTTVQVVKWNS